MDFSFSKQVFMYLLTLLSLCFSTPSSGFKPIANRQARASSSIHSFLHDNGSERRLRGDGDAYPRSYEIKEKHNDMEILLGSFGLSEALLWESGEDLVYFLNDDEECIGNECEEDCLIPEEYKALGQASSLDVLEYLGIRRADPVRMQKKYETIWE